MKRAVLGGLLGLAVITLASVANAQGPPRGAGMGRGGMAVTGLLNQKSVQEELKLSEDQVKSVKELAEKQRDGWSGLRDLSPEERMAKIQERIKQNEKDLSGVIGADQLGRLKQISLQTRGASAFSDPTVVTALGLTDEQKEKIKTIQDDARKARGEFDRENPEESRKKIAAARKEASEKAAGVLTTEQTTKWKEMTGAPFTGEIRWDFGGRRRGGGDRPRGNTPPPDQA